MLSYILITAKFVCHSFFTFALFFAFGLETCTKDSSWSLTLFQYLQCQHSLTCFFHVPKSLNNSPNSTNSLNSPNSLHSPNKDTSKEGDSGEIGESVGHKPIYHQFFIQALVMRARLGARAVRGNNALRKLVLARHDLDGRLTPSDGKHLGHGITKNL